VNDEQTQQLLDAIQTIADELTRLNNNLEEIQQAIDEHI
jgi:hypothetical protein|tara:strand:- start:2221 stop:2337 length:117 start_codon:yes stop_codon:yes gene_type:complete